jgi:hypothetical protein
LFTYALPQKSALDTVLTVSKSPLLTFEAVYLYILNNNHVLALSDQAVAGEDVSQPGLIDNSCRSATIVADFTGAAPLGSNVDAAVGQLRAGQMDSTGFIEDIGVTGNSIVNPSVGLRRRWRRRRCSYPHR